MFKECQPLRLRGYSTCIFAGTLVQIFWVIDFFGHLKFFFFSFQINPKNLDPSDETDQDFLDCFEREKTHLIATVGNIIFNI